eukprot:CAMPEP_0197682680 /NCGR_PEP_ID=MMETSP1338-20131121/96829_1 /TAXON_ID=43686 ORGANISM="Pelagodinium beii, Strain RCC1491" /NCGR_SAMPLE_ID=MMETSP1338 /ASSEMBLY_ACC=CAM_ASM_000754 /LENGTH=328 /DNA_ID=CAMNT_0043264167 /DNA_START=24 /DNA_END=1010 /DNA_ORIENTATION=+
MALACAMAHAEPQACKSASMVQLSAMKTDQVQVVVMIMTAPLSQERRDQFRSALQELTANVKVNDIPVQFVTQFAVGDTYPCYNETEQARARNLLNAESEKYGDIAFLNITDACKPHKLDWHFFNRTGYPWPLSYCDNGKSWHLFQWAHRHYPKAKLVFKQDDDAIVDWRVLLPGMLASAAINQSLDSPESFHRLFLGTQHKLVTVTNPNRTCSEGQLYGFSSDLLSWVGKNTAARVAVEDLEACNWADAFDDAHPTDPVNRHGIVPGLTATAEWEALVHPVKEESLFTTCMRDKVHGCNVDMQLLAEVAENGTLSLPTTTVHWQLSS